jgi:hypothetical protein
VWSSVDDRYPPSIVSLKARCRAMAHVSVEPAGSILVDTSFSTPPTKGNDPNRGAPQGWSGTGRFYFSLFDLGIDVTPRR